MAARLTDYIANQRQKDLLSCLAGVFGAVGDTSSAAYAGLAVDGGSGDTPFGPRQIVVGKSLLGDQGEKLAAYVSANVYYLMERRAIDFIYDDNGIAGAASQGSTAGFRRCACSNLHEHACDRVC